MTFKISLGLDLANNNKTQEYFNIIDETKDLVYFYKINPAFFIYNRKSIKTIIDYIKLNECKCIYDGKLSDVPHSSKNYAEYLYDYLKVDGATLNPYLGKSALIPFFKYSNKLNFILCRTTNNDAGYIQDDSYKKVYDIANSLGGHLIVPSNKGGYLEDAIINCPNSLILSPGIGKQGGKIKEISKEKIIYSISRSIINAEDPREELINYVFS